MTWPTVKALDLFAEGRRKKQEEGNEREATKVGTLRAGSAGCVLEGGEVIGTCHRIALLRYLGVQDAPTDQTQNIWDNGEANEWNWQRHMDLGWSGTWTGDSAYPMTWSVSGVPVTGRPDLIMLDETGKAVHGIELKVVEAINSAIGILYERKPKADNLIQAGLYSWQLDVPYSLVYSSNAMGDAPYWAIKKGLVPKGEKVVPGKIEFELHWDEDGVLWYRLDGIEVPTVITQGGIEGFYQLILDMADQKDLYERYSSLNQFGENQGFDKCNYCSLKRQCDKYEISQLDYDGWIEEVKETWHTDQKT